jgi:DnaK suppressor protein
MKRTTASAKQTVLSKKIAGQKLSRKYANLTVSELTVGQHRELELKLKKLREEFRSLLKEKANQFNIAAMNESITKGDDAEVAEKQRMNNAALQELEFLKTRLQLVSRAIAKINAGVYGICEETEEPIGFERLNIVPWAKYSVHIQEVRERKMKEFRANKTRAEL